MLGSALALPEHVLPLSKPHSMRTAQYVSSMGWARARRRPSRRKRRTRPTPTQPVIYMANAQVTATVTRPKWKFKVLAYAGGKVEVFDDYQCAQGWTRCLGGGVVYPINLVADYTASSVTLREGLKVHQPEDEIGQFLLAI